MANFHATLKDSRNLTDKCTKLGEKQWQRIGENPKFIFLLQYQETSAWQCLAVYFLITTAPVFLASGHREQAKLTVGMEEDKYTVAPSACKQRVALLLLSFSCITELQLAPGSNTYMEYVHQSVTCMMGVEQSR